MKKLFIAVVAIAALCACGNGEKKAGGRKR